MWKGQFLRAMGPLKGKVFTITENRTSWTSHFPSFPRKPTKPDLSLPKTKFHLPFTPMYFLSREGKG